MQNRNQSMDCFAASINSIFNGKMIHDLLVRDLLSPRSHRLHIPCQVLRVEQQNVAYLPLLTVLMIGSLKYEHNEP